MKFKFYLIFVLGLLLGQSALAQVSASYNAEFDQRERARIESERAQATQKYEGEAAECYQRFAVNDCLRDMRRRRRAVMEELHRQEVALNSERRAASTLQHQREVVERTGQHDDGVRDRAAAAADKEARPKTQPSPQGAPSQERTATPSLGELTDKARADNERRYDEKQQRAQEHRQERERDQAKPGTSTVKPLPAQP